MHTIKIDRTMPYQGPRLKYPFPDMKVGHSFLVPGVEGVSSFKSASRARAAASMFSKKHPGVAFSILKTPEGYRCWRIA